MADLHEAPWHDAVKDWYELQRTYPEARFTSDAGGNWYSGSLRPGDDDVQAGSLDALIVALTAREAG